jgi:pimeloyl-ACP methyl ester carboxylesterase
VGRRLVAMAAAWLLGCGTPGASRLTRTQPRLPEVPAPLVDENTPGILELESRWLVHPSQPGKVMVFEGGPTDGGRPPLVLVHGLGQGSRDFRPVFAALARERRVISFDLPGFGISERGGAYTPERYAALLDHVIASTGAEQVDLLGHSLGGAIALLYAGGHAGRVRRLVLADVAGVLHREAFVGGQLERLNGSAIADSAGDSLRQFASALRAFEPELDPLISLRMLDGAPAKAAALALIEFNFGWALTGVQAPTLILWGERDQTAARRTADLLHARIAGSRLELLPGVGHVPMNDAPRRMAELVVEHLDGPAPPVEAVTPAVSDRVGTCRDRRDASFEGAYARIEIHDCPRVTLSNVSTGTLSIRQSDATLTHVEVREGLRVDDSELVITGGSLRGRIALDVSGSRLDVAGVELKGEEAAVRARRVSYLLFSVTPASSQLGTSFLHRELHLHSGRKL